MVGDEALLSLADWKEYRDVINSEGLVWVLCVEHSVNATRKFESRFCGLGFRGSKVVHAAGNTQNTEPNRVASFDEAPSRAVSPRSHACSRAIALRSLSQEAARLANASKSTRVGKRPVIIRCVSD